MNSEVPPIPESENSKLDSHKSLEQLELKELSVESTSETMTDAWSNEDIIDVDVDVVPTDSQPTQDRASEKSVEFDLELEESEFVSSDNLNTNLQPEVPEVGDLSAVDIALENSNPEPEPKPEPEPEPENSTSETSSETSIESELFVDSWLDEPTTNESETETSGEEDHQTIASQDNELSELEQQKAALQGEIIALKAQKDQMVSSQIFEIQEILKRTIEEGTHELRERRTALQIEIEKLERRKERIDREMRANFAGSSQELAIKVQGFKNYLVGSLQDLARAADKLELANTEASPSRTKPRRSREEDSSDDWGVAPARQRAERDRNRDLERNNRGSRGSREDRGDRGSRGGRGSRSRERDSAATTTPQGQFSEPTFGDRSRQIRQLIDRYRNTPDYYGAPWQLRRTFEPIHAKKVQDWFFVQGGRGAVDTMGSRLQNILVASAIVSILHSLYGDRCRVLVLTDTPENLGEWRRGLQDCLGISRSNFGSNRGITLFDAPEVVVQRAERLIADKLLPIIIIDETEELLNLSMLKFPLWLAFASTAKPASSNYLY